MYIILYWASYKNEQNITSSSKSNTTRILCALSVRLTRNIQKHKTGILIDQNNAFQKVSKLKIK